MSSRKKDEKEKRNRKIPKNIEYRGKREKRKETQKLIRRLSSQSDEKANNLDGRSWTVWQGYGEKRKT